MPRAGPLRYWLLTFVGAILFLASVAAVVWGTYHLIGTESCGTRTTQECSSETGLYIMAVVLAPFVGGFGGDPVRVPWRDACGGGAEKRVADMVARGEMLRRAIARPRARPPAPAAPSTWQPNLPPERRARSSGSSSSTG